MWPQENRRLLELATLACRLARDEEEERRGGKGKCVAFSYPSSRREERKAAPFLDPTIPSSSAETSRPYRKMRMATPVLMGWLERCLRMGGTPPRLVVRKELTNSDVDPYYGRLLLPNACPADPSRGGVQLLLDELSAVETLAVKGPGLSVTVLDRWGRIYEGSSLKVWAGKFYVITGGQVWKRILADNMVRRGDVVDVFRFRVPPSPLARSEKECRDGRGKAQGKLVLVVSVMEERRGHLGEQHHLWVADIPRRPRSTAMKAP